MLIALPITIFYYFLLGLWPNLRHIHTYIIRYEVGAGASPSSLFVIFPSFSFFFLSVLICILILPLHFCIFPWNVALLLLDQRFDKVVVDFSSYDVLIYSYSASLLLVFTEAKKSKSYVKQYQVKYKGGGEVSARSFVSMDNSLTQIIQQILIQASIHTCMYTYSYTYVYI
mgnify:FL=1